MKKLFATLFFFFTAMISVSGFCATREEMEETFFRTWNTKFLGIDNVMTPFGIFAVKKSLNRYENVFIFNNLSVYNNQPEDEYVYL